RERAVRGSAGDPAARRGSISRREVPLQECRARGIRAGRHCAGDAASGPRAAARSAVLGRAGAARARARHGSGAVGPLVLPRMAHEFPPDFVWGAATAAYQIEGSPLADGAGPSNWHRFSHDPRLMASKGDTGDVACDHYNRVGEDVALMKRLGLQAYRFSVAWGRVLPEGTGRVNE